MNTPTDYPALSAYITVKEAAKAIDFYKAAFGATELFRLTMGGPDFVGHAELLINETLVMLSEEFPGMSKSPHALGGSPVTFCLIVDNADAAFAKAVAAGATVLRAVADQFYGFRSGCVTDPFGHQWMIQHQTEKLTPQQMQERMSAMPEGC
ncbi:VOC family protein [Prosthecobacter sp.]|uniref:VOC family protein n=1 Tax=Prosthecobacter sp. TaxID=1965333 RepID=UPI002ABA4D6D|nr:VOC family protein [Prosthecobacter sp.]MDZ4404877.1 VOC family protein [Prosthecobacter sp.]